MKALTMTATVLLMATTVHAEPAMWRWTVAPLNNAGGVNVYLQTPNGRIDGDFGPRLAEIDLPFTYYPLVEITWGPESPGYWDVIHDMTNGVDDLLIFGVGTNFTTEVMESDLATVWRNDHRPPEAVDFEGIVMDKIVARVTAFGFSGGNWMVTNWQGYAAPEPSGLGLLLGGVLFPWRRWRVCR